ncbi:MAG: LPS export ABC transporter periplasmic protein LptC [Lentisphaerae bacterium]|nr:LPS export ABC transporter periplasmic protein LptC [Lentisphaerota bacterium]
MKMHAMALVCAAALAWPGTPAGAQELADTPQVFNDFRLPEYDEAGRLKTDVRGDQAVMHTNGVMDVTNVRVVCYEEGRPVMRISAPRCTYYGDKQVVESTSRVLVEREDILISGVGFRCRLKDRQMKISSNAKIVLSRLKDQVIKESETP